MDTHFLRNIYEGLYSSLFYKNHFDYLRLYIPPTRKTKRLPRRLVCRVRTLLISQQRAAPLRVANWTCRFSAIIASKDPSSREDLLECGGIELFALIIKKWGTTVKYFAHWTDQMPIFSFSKYFEQKISLQVYSWKITKNFSWMENFSKLTCASSGCNTSIARTTRTGCLVFVVVYKNRTVFVQNAFATY